MAVPGPVRSPSSVGCNDLLADSPATAVARNATDVLVAVGLQAAVAATVDGAPAPAHHR